MKNQIPSVCSMNENIPQSVENIILKACAKNPKNRYNTVKDMYADIETCLDEDRVDEKRYVYPYSETEELENTKEVKTIKEVEKQETTELDELEENEDKNQNKLLITLGIIIAAIILGIVLMFIIFMKKPKVKEITVPDVSNLNVAQAEAKLKDLGFTISEEQEEQASDTVEEGYVIKTNPQSGVKRKKGTPITLVVSIGENTIELENYVGQNYYEIKGKLEAYGIIVNEETKDIEKGEEVKENQIMEQRPIAGTKLKSGETVTLIIPNLVVNYPNFVEEEGWSIEAITRFCEANKISVTFLEQETDTYPEGTIIKQDHVAGTRVKEGYPLTITVAKAKKVEKPQEPEAQETEETTPQGN